MTDAKALFDQGKLLAAIEQLTQDVRSNPVDLRSRIFLFELLCFAGDFERADKQLDVVAHQSDAMQVGTAVYKQVLAAEKARQAVFALDQLPDFLMTPPEHAAFHLEALKLMREGEPAKARILLQKALDLRPTQTGQVDGAPFHELEDADPFVGPFLEVIVNGRYAWLPFEQLRRIQIARPQQLRDLIWARARIESRGENAGEVFLPVLYPGSAEHQDESVKLGRTTNWIDNSEGLARGIGQRMFLIDGQERAMLEVADIQFGEVGS